MPRTSRSRWFAVLLGAAALAASGVAAGPASAAPGKEFTLKIAPGQVPGGATGYELTATLTNPRPANEQVGSANLTPPPGITVTAASVREMGRAEIVDGTVRLRDLALPPGTQQRTVKLQVAAGCEPSGPAAWTVVAKQANDFNGSGNDLSLSTTSSVRTSVTGCGRLVWKRQPTNAQINSLISGTAYVDTADKPQVAVEDADGAVITSATGGVTLSLGVREGDGALQGGSSDLAPTGRATFGDVKITRPGVYSLVATVTSGPYAGKRAESDRIRLSEVVSTCTSGVLCTGSVVRSFATFAVNALPGLDTPFITLSGDPGLSLTDAQCSAGPWPSYRSSTVLFEVTRTGREKTISITIGKRVLQLDPDNGAPRMDLCFASPVPFAVKGAPPVAPFPTFDWNSDGTKDPVFAGLLPNCGSAPPPCVSQRKKTAGGNGYIEARLPTGLGDPLMRT